MNSIYNIDEYLWIHPNCIISKGRKRATIQNIVDRTFDIVPLELVNVIEEAKNQKISFLYSHYEEHDFPVLDTYIEFIIKKGYGVLCGEKDGIFKAELEVFKNWDMPFTIENAIIDYNFNLDFYFEKAIKDLAELSCNFLQIRFLDKNDFKKAEDIISMISDIKMFNGLSVIMNFIPNFENETFEAFVLQYPIIHEFILFNSPKDQIVENQKCRFKTIFLKNEITHKSCGAISPFYFTSNIEHYTESLHHNTCLNRKIAIDAEGNIKNCPSMKESFGNIKDTTLEEAINKPGFKKYWNIKKDEITKCKDCEFRHVCTDCRAYVEEPEYAGERAPSPSGRVGEGLYSAPLKCGYNPYTCEWEEWSTNPLKQKAIDYYGMRDLVKDEK